MNIKSRVKKSMILLLVGVAINVALAITKLHVGLSSNSLTITLDATNSFFDILTCFVTMLAFLLLLIPRSENVPHGYGRSEYLAGFIVSIVSVVVGALFFIRSLNRLAMPEPVWFGWENCVLISVAVPVKLGIALLYRFFNRKLKSKALYAIMIDSFMDTAITGVSLVSFLVSSKVDYAVDAIVGIILSIVLVAFAIKTVVDNAKAVIAGDGANEERECLAKLCESEGVEQKSVDIHDYGYGAKCGKATLVSAEKDGDKRAEIANRIQREIFVQTGAEIDVAVVFEADANEKSQLTDGEKSGDGES